MGERIDRALDLAERAVAALEALASVARDVADRGPRQPKARERRAVPADKMHAHVRGKLRRAGALDR